MLSSRWLLAALVAFSLTTTGCENAPPAGGKTIDQIKAEGGMPIDVIEFKSVMASGGKGFVMKVRNSSNVPVLGFKATAMLTAPDPKGRRSSQQSLDYPDLPQPVLPGADLELSWRPKDPDADAGQVLLKEARYQATGPQGGRQTFLIQNAKYDAQCRAIQ